MVNYVQEGEEGVNDVQDNKERDMSEDTDYVTEDEDKNVEKEGDENEGVELDNEKEDIFLSPIEGE